jgi:zinc D-Ala-D-Ala carboxypeptidase
MKVSENFNSEEFKCKCGKCDLEIDQDFIDKLQIARTKACIPFKILSGCRCEAHNKRVGGAKNSAHLRCCAADIEVTVATKGIILKALREAGFKRIGIDDSFIHADTDKINPPAEWYYN